MTMRHNYITDLDKVTSPYNLSSLTESQFIYFITLYIFLGFFMAGCGVLTLRG